MDNTGFTFNEIHQQPAMWRKELKALLEKQEEVSAFMHKYLTPDTDIVLTGAGTSAFIGDALQPVMRGMWHNVRSVATTDIITHANYLLNPEKPLLLVSFARSGNSPESVGAVNLANKLCKPFAKHFATTFPECAEALGAKAEMTGTPLRPELFSGSREKGLSFLSFDGTKPVLLMMGGSSGAQSVNACLRKALPALTPDFDIIHICGKGNLDETLQGIPGYRQIEFLDAELPDVLACTDLVLSRAGANAL